MLDVKSVDALVHLFVRAVGVLLVEILLPRIVRWVADNDRNVALVLRLDAGGVFVDQAKQRHLLTRVGKPYVVEPYRQKRYQTARNCR